jgi:antitoxin (DNA-binding transcriptional repressor) of toxin-antitoxin stability system
MTVCQIIISEFEVHCAEEIREVEKGDLVLELTRDGKTVAVVKAADPNSPAPTLRDWLGSGRGTVTFGPGYDPHAPAYDEEDWES